MRIKVTTSSTFLISHVLNTYHEDSGTINFLNFYYFELYSLSNIYTVYFRPSMISWNNITNAAPWLTQIYLDTVMFKFFSLTSDNLLPISAHIHFLNVVFDPESWLTMLFTHKLCAAAHTHSLKIQIKHHWLAKCRISKTQVSAHIRPTQMCLVHIFYSYMYHMYPF